MIKYLGSKRRLVPVLGDLLVRSGAATALDLFTGTTRVARAFKEEGALVTAVDTARYSEVFGKCYLEIDADTADTDEVVDALDRLNGLEGSAGYFTDTFSHQSRFFQPHNAERVDAIREVIESDYRDSWMYPVLLTSLILAADRVDSTTGVQMAYVKKWAPRSFKPLELRVPDLLAGGGQVVRGDAVELAGQLGSFDLAYLDPPYNQHRYFTNYHIWETLVAWDHPEHYGVACKRLDSREDATKSVFNKKREMPAALGAVIAKIDATLLVLSYNNESWIDFDALVELLQGRGRVLALAFDSKRYVGAQIGIHDPQGQRVGEVSHLRNLEYVLVAGEGRLVDRVVEPFGGYLVPTS
ncbi:MAG: DNA adenine methylase [Acidimicrobiia bacterium]|nr:DNA adenine methylase [Acidimicrobiia bacterium]